MHCDVFFCEKTLLNKIILEKQFEMIWFRIKKLLWMKWIEWNEDENKWRINGICYSEYENCVFFSSRFIIKIRNNSCDQVLIKNSTLLSTRANVDINLQKHLWMKFIEIIYFVYIFFVILSNVSIELTWGAQILRLFFKGNSLTIHLALIISEHCWCYEMSLRFIY